MGIDTASYFDYLDFFRFFSLIEFDFGTWR